MKTARGLVTSVTSGFVIGGVLALVVVLMLYAGYTREFVYTYLVACVAISVSAVALILNVKQARQTGDIQKEQTKLIRQIVRLLERDAQPDGGVGRAVTPSH